MRTAIKSYIKKKLGKHILIGSYNIGLLYFLSKKLTPSTHILMYHSVADQSKAQWVNPHNHVPGDVFEEQMKFLAEKKQVISLDRLVKHIVNQEVIPDDTIVITFDDGYLDNLTVAAPILERYGLTATIFLPTGYIDRGETQWVDQVYTVLKYARNTEYRYCLDFERVFNLSKQRQMLELRRVLNEIMITADLSTRTSVLHDLQQQLEPVAMPPRLTMNWNEVRQILQEYTCFKIGGHSVEHTDLTAISQQLAEKEIIQCRDRIRQELWIVPQFFSFPYGRTSAQLREGVIKAGFKSACGGEGIDQSITHENNVLQLPRVAAPSNMMLFKLLIDPHYRGFWKRLYP